MDSTSRLHFSARYSPDKSFYILCNSCPFFNLKFKSIYTRRKPSNSGTGTELTLFVHIFRCLSDMLLSRPLSWWQFQWNLWSQAFQPVFCGCWRGFQPRNRFTGTWIHLWLFTARREGPHAGLSSFQSLFKWALTMTVPCNFLAVQRKLGSSLDSKIHRVLSQLQSMQSTSVAYVWNSKHNSTSRRNIWPWWKCSLFSPSGLCYCLSDHSHCHGHLCIHSVSLILG